MDRGSTMDRNAQELKDGMDMKAHGHEGTRKVLKSTRRLIDKIEQEKRTNMDT